MSSIYLKKNKCGEVPEWTSEVLREVTVRRLRKPRSLDCQKKMRPILQARRTIKPVTFYNHPPLFWTFASWGFGATEKLGNQPNSRTRMASESGLSLRMVTNAHYHRFGLFSSYEELSTLFFFSEVYFLSTTKHAAYLVYAVRATLERKSAKKSDARPANPPTSGGATGVPTIHIGL